MEQAQCLRVLGRLDRCGLDRFVVGPQRHREAVAYMETRLHPRVGLSHRAPVLGESAGNHDFEVVVGGLTSERRDTRENIAWSETDDDAVRVVNHGRMVDVQSQRGGR